MAEKKIKSVEKKCKKCGGKLKTIYLVDFGIADKSLKTKIDYYECEKCGEKIDA
jgi:DNA-directed RNA polymerase subunit M/transcription elongation factor TFIIS